MLANVAEMYYLEGLNQSTIAHEIGVTRSMVSRMLTEARNQGIVNINIIRPIYFDHQLEETLRACYNIESVNVVSVEDSRRGQLLQDLGQAAADLLKKCIHPNSIIGVAWGTTVSATIEAVQPVGGLSVKIVQLIGAQSAKNIEYDGHALVKRLVEKLGGDGFYINAPCICPSFEIAQSLRETKGIQETIEMGKQVQIALLGVGTTEIEYSSFFLSGLLNEDELDAIRRNGVVGDIAGNYFNRDGIPYKDDFLRRMITIRREDLEKIPIRIGIAGGHGKVKAIFGALNSQLITHLVTDSNTAREITQ